MLSVSSIPEAPEAGQTAGTCTGAHHYGTLVSSSSHPHSPPTIGVVCIFQHGRQRLVGCLVACRAPHGRDDLAAGQHRAAQAAAHRGCGTHGAQHGQAAPLLHALPVRQGQASHEGLQLLGDGGGRCRLPLLPLGCHPLRVAQHGRAVLIPQAAQLHHRLGQHRGRLCWHSPICWRGLALGLSWLPCCAP